MGFCIICCEADVVSAHYKVEESTEFMALVYSNTHQEARSPTGHANVRGAYFYNASVELSHPIACKVQ